MTTAAEIVQRAKSGWPYDAVPYSQSGVFNDDDGAGPHIGGYRRDCSGLATLAGGGPTPGYSTVTMLTTGWVKPITWAALAPGDFVGALGPGTAGDAGHVMVVVAVNHAGGTYTVYEQAGYGPGPDENTYRIGDGQGRSYLPYRLSTLEGEMPTQPAHIAPGAPFPLTGNNVFGDINGPDWSHGGDPAYDSAQVIAQVGAIQAALVAGGYAGQVDAADWVDCRYEAPTTAAVRALQRAHGLPETGNVDAATWAALFPAPAPVQPPAPPVVQVDPETLAAAVRTEVTAQLAKVRATTTLALGE